ncbi:MAG TPA: Pycsar system effector family protein [Saprospiraceae bacterium]|nr:Pycsar system effector family protein [Saprospiraceae bacterium]
MEIQQSLVNDVRAFVEEYYQNNISEQFLFHNFAHTQDVVAAARLMAEKSERLSPKEIYLLEVAAWFHDTGYSQGPREHEQRSANLARQFLTDQNIPAEDIQKVEQIILATSLKAAPDSFAEEILRDADFSHLGSEQYWDRCSRLRQELLMTQQDFKTEMEWAVYELDFVTRHQYHTLIARGLYESTKQKNIKRLKKYLKRVQAGENNAPDGTSKKKKKKKKGKDLELKQLNLGRGVETMYRTTYRTHVNLSSIADNKANIMLSINAIIISIVVSNLVPKFDQNFWLIIPTTILLATCLAALVFAILSTRPKVTEGKFSREDIRRKKSNLLFFGNFYNMDLEDFHWGMTEMIKDSDFLYSSMTRDLYYLGVVLAKKYRYLRICYGIFMYGLITAVIAFGLAFLLGQQAGQINF